MSNSLRNAYEIGHLRGSVNSTAMSLDAAISILEIYVDKDEHGIKSCLKRLKEVQETLASIPNKSADAALAQYPDE